MSNYNVQIAVGPERKEGERLGDYLMRIFESEKPKGINTERKHDTNNKRNKLPVQL